ncbi:L,D-transpeptidase family protein [Pontibacter beigongshangensis]|uniref:L,D-transpeptidase family protein n=1 Tax=Pontibacter beigongshangensis TaxID=2574733 RepID=UPI00164EE112|nr:L,D-transpeptidase family protein [Pontibacter beigongshangensis]
MKACLGYVIGLLFVAITACAGMPPAYPGGADNQYARLQEQLQLYKQMDALDQWHKLPDGTCLQVCDSGALVPALRHNLLLTRDLNKPADSTSLLFDEELKEAVRKFQQRHGLLVDGIVGQQTLEALAVPPAARVQQIELNMERWRLFYEASAGPTVFVNIPEYALYLIDENWQTVWQTRVVVGLAGRSYQTVQMEDTITYLVFNPTWTVPQSIIRREIIPILAKDTGYLARNHMKAYRISGSRRTGISAGSLDWATADPDQDNFIVVQEAGPWNALGKVKFMFPNRFSIYLHDTPAKALFNQLNRAYSHGCVRVQNPEKLAAYLLSTDWENLPDISPYLNSNTPERVVSLPQPVPIRIGYMTSWVDDAGLLQFRKDVYHRDTALPLPVPDIF